MEVNLKLGQYQIKDNPQRETISNKRQYQIEDNLKWKTISNVKEFQMEWKTDQL